MDKELLDKGLRVRREVLGDEYVDRSMKNADEFNPVSYTHLTLPTILRV